jgi:hypothetical protein
MRDLFGWSQELATEEINLCLGELAPSRVCLGLAR